LSKKCPTFTHTLHLQKPTSKCLHVTGRLIQLNNSVSPSLILLFKDITSLKALEQAEAESKYKGLVLASASHELRTPLNGIIGSLQILEGFTSKEGKEFITIATTSCKLLMSLINDILDYSRIESGKFSLNKDYFDIRLAIQECMDLIRFQTKQKGVRLLSEVQSDVPQMVFSDVNRFKQVLINLLGNAVKFTLEGHIKVKATLLSLKTETIAKDLFSSSSRNKIQIEIEDTGLGIKSEDMSSLFKMFGKLKNTDHINTHGVGMGLTICKNLCEQLGGIIRVKSKYNEGSSFSFTLDIEKELVINKVPVKHWLSSVSSERLRPTLNRTLAHLQNCLTPRGITRKDVEDILYIDEEPEKNK